MKVGKLLRYNTPVNAITRFDELKCYGWLKTALNGMKLASPTPIQCNTIPAALQGKQKGGFCNHI